MVEKRASRRSGAAPTVADVARAAGVSPMTVSRVVNGEPNVLDKTRARVRAAVDDLGYRPNVAARSLAGARQDRIALLYANPSAAYLSELLKGCLEQAGAKGLQLILEHFDPNEALPLLAARLVSQRINAVLVPPPLCDLEPLLEVIRQARLPMVQIATGNPSRLAHAVTIDDEAAAFALVRYLLEIGHRRIGFIEGDSNQTVSALRRKGYERALAAADILPDQSLVVEGDFTYRSGLAASENLLALGERPTAIFASNDDMAAATVAVAHKHGLSVPEDLSVCGFDDTAMATTIWPRLTTVRQPVAEMARIAIEILVQATEGGRSSGDRGGEHVQLAFEIVKRDSVAPR